MITARQSVRISDACTAIIGKTAILYYAGHAIHEVSAEAHMKEIDDSFQLLAAELGYSVEKITKE